MGTFRDLNELVNEWIKAKGKEETDGKKKLVQEIKTWIQAMHAEVDQNDLDIARVGCENIYENGNTLKEEEKELCAFLVAHLLKMQEQMRTVSGNDPVDVKIKDYIQCVMRQVLFSAYRSSYCRFKEIMESVEEAMYTLCDGIAQGEKCNKCRYTTIKIEHVNKVNIHGLIIEKLNVQRGMLQKIHSMLPRSLCNGNSGRKNSVSQLGPSGSGHGTRTTESATTTTVSGQQTHPPNEAGDVARSATNSATSRDPAGWGDLLFILSPEQPEMIITRAPDNRYNHKMVEEHQGESGSRKNLYLSLRCRHSEWTNVLWGEIKDRVSDFSREISKSTANVDNVCNSITGADEKTKKVCQYITAGLKYTYGIEKETDRSKDKNPEYNWKLKTTTACMVLNAYGDILKEQGNLCITEETLKKAFTTGQGIKNSACKESSCGDCQRDTCADLPINGKNLRKKIKDELQKNDKIQETLRDINNFCTRIQCVIKKWFPNRGRTESDKGDVNTLWNHDVKKLLNNLSGAMTTTDTPDEKLCNGMEEKSRKACELILKGLKHIYKIKKGDDRSNPKKVLDDQIFHRTMSCLLLNAYAKKIEEKAQERGNCEVKSGIQYAFQKSKDIKDGTTECKDDNNCHVCQKESYEQCEINHEKIKDRVNKLLDGKKDEIQTTLTTICPPPAPIPKAKSQTTSTKDCNGDITCLNEKVGQMFQKRWSATKEQVYSLFDEFSSEVDENDKKSSFGTVCDEIAERSTTQGKNFPRCFCKILIKNLVKVTNNKSTYTYNGNTWNVSDINIKARCDLLNLWLLLYGPKYKVTEDNIKYAFRAISNLKQLYGQNEYEECIHKGNFSVNEADDGARYKDIYSWFMNERIKTKMWKISDGSACSTRSRAQNHSTILPKKELEEINPQLETKAESIAKEIEKKLPIVEEIDGEINSTKSALPTSQSSSTGSNCSNIKIQGVENDEEGIELLSLHFNLHRINISYIVCNVLYCMSIKRNILNVEVYSCLYYLCIIFVEEWEEVFTEFFNYAVQDGKGYNYEEVEAMSAWCKSEEDKDMFNKPEHKDFCKTLIKNILLVKNSGHECVTKGKTNEHGKPCVKKCDLLNMWLMIMADYCVPMEIVKPIFKAVEEVRGDFFGIEDNAECMYGKISILDKTNASRLQEVLDWLRRKARKGCFGNTDKYGVCKRWSDNYVARSKGKSGSSVSKKHLNGKLKDWVDKLEEAKGKTETVLKEIREAAAKPPTTGEQPASGAKDTAGSTKPATENTTPDITKRTNSGSETQTSDQLSKTDKDKQGECEASSKSISAQHDFGAVSLSAGCISRKELGESDLSQFPEAVFIDPSAIPPGVVVPEDDSKDTEKKGVQDIDGAEIQGTGDQKPDSGDKSPLPAADGGNVGVNQSGSKDVIGGEVGNSLSSPDNSVPGQPAVVPASSQSPLEEQPPQKADAEIHNPSAPVVPGVAPGVGTAGSVTIQTPTVSRTRAKIKTVPKTPKVLPLINRIDHPFLPYLPTIPVLIGTSVISYLLWKYFAVSGKRKRYKRAHQVRGPSSLGEQLLDRVDDQDDGPHEYTLVKERKPRRPPRRSSGKKAVSRRMIIDIHLEVLDECQKGVLHSTKEDYFTILVEEFMGRNFVKGENVLKEGVPKEQIPSTDSRFSEEDFFPREEVSKEQLPMVDVPKEQVASSDSGF
ncbi:SICA antigen [Plasmodium coatneyi]|uniref:SICA antigen n=1 Tax=Plasmodium coatneyi TaxID=208452 RepID=A0A1B1E601_9APIC|nr:SICA antigen [Plasmodium coatneyi]ANQ10441.1 SICA antigen [Plasmodium coatneyi]